MMNATRQLNKKDGLPPNERSYASRQQAAQDKANGLTPALEAQVEALFHKTKARDYPVFFSRYGRSYRMELESCLGGIVCQAVVVNNATNNAFLMIHKSSSALFREATR